MRISHKVSEKIQAIAIEDGIPYQTLMSSILHCDVTGRLVDRLRPNESFESDG